MKGAIISPLSLCKFIPIIFKNMDFFIQTLYNVIQVNPTINKDKKHVRCKIVSNRQKRFNALLIAAALVIIGFVTVFYVNQLNKVISQNIISSISEIAEHDKAAYDDEWEK